MFWFCCCNLDVIILEDLHELCSRWGFSFGLSMVRCSDTQIFAMNVFNAIPLHDFLAIGYITEKKILLEKYLSIYISIQGICFDTHCVRYPHYIQPLLLEHPVNSISESQWHYLWLYYALCLSVQWLCWYLLVILISGAILFGIYMLMAHLSINFLLDILFLVLIRPLLWQ